MCTLHMPVHVRVCVGKPEHGEPHGITSPPLGPGGGKGQSPLLVTALLPAPCHAVCATFLQDKHFS